MSWEQNPTLELDDSADFEVPASTESEEEARMHLM